MKLSILPPSVAVRGSDDSDDDDDDDEVRFCMNAGLVVTCVAEVASS